MRQSQTQDRRDHTERAVHLTTWLLVFRSIRVVLGLLILGAFIPPSFVRLVVLVPLFLGTVWCIRKLRNAIDTFRSEEQAAREEDRYWVRVSAEADERRKDRELREQQARQKQEVRRVLIRHERALAARRRQLLISDPYGIEDRSKWEAELEYFIRRVLSPAVEVGRFDAAFRHELAAFIDKEIDAGQRLSAGRAPELNVDVDSMTGIEFESLCAQELARVGWTTRLTSASHDQGVDVVAERGQVTLVLQCKRYGRPVGNKAVQEVFAAKAHALATHAAVVTNAGFTPAAIELARTCGVFLLHVSDLPRVEEILAQGGGYERSG